MAASVSGASAGFTEADMDLAFMAAFTEADSDLAFTEADLEGFSGDMEAALADIAESERFEDSTAAWESAAITT